MIVVEVRPTGGRPVSGIGMRPWDAVVDALYRGQPNRVTVEWDDPAQDKWTATAGHYWVGEYRPGCPTGSWQRIYDERTAPSEAESAETLWRELAVQEPDQGGYRYATFLGAGYRVRCKGPNFRRYAAYQQQQPSGGWHLEQRTSRRPHQMDSDALREAARDIVSAHQLDTRL